MPVLDYCNELVEEVQALIGTGPETVELSDCAETVPPPLTSSIIKISRGEAIARHKTRFAFLPDTRHGSHFGRLVTCVYYLEYNCTFTMWRY